MTVSKVLVRSIVLAGITAAAGCNSAATRPNPLPSVPPVPVAAKMALSGTIFDGTGAPLEGVVTTASLVGASLTLIREATTDAAGRFSLGTIDLLSTNQVMLSASKPGYGPYAQMLSPSSSVQVDVWFALPILPRLRLTANFTDTLLPSDPPVYVGEPYESEYAWQAKSIYFEAPGDADIDVVLTWSRVGNATLGMWASNGDIKSHADDSSQTIRLPRGTTGTLIVGQPSAAGRLTQSVPFTLATTAVKR